jgi:hypothetical protein
MTTTYELRIYDGTTLKGIISDMLYLNYTRKVNSICVCQFAIGENHPYASQIVKNYRVEVWRKTEHISFYKEDVFILRSKKYTWNGKTNDLVVGAVGGNWLLSTRIIAYAAGTSGKNAFSSIKAETVAKELVKYNLGSSATTGNGRKVDGVLSSVAVEADGATGNDTDINCAWDNLLETLQVVSRKGGGDFNMVWTGTQWEFRWYNGQLGLDLRATLIFSLKRGNLEKPVLTTDWTSEKTLAIIGGQGEGIDRAIRTRQGTDYSSANQVEMFVDARDVEAGSANENTLLDQRGDSELDSARTHSVLDFSIIQFVNSRYGEDYSLGDLARVDYAGVTDDVQINQVVVNFQAEKDEVINIGVRNV